MLRTKAINTDKLEPDSEEPGMLSHKQKYYYSPRKTKEGVWNNVVGIKKSMWIISLMFQLQN